MISHLLKLIRRLFSARQIVNETVQIIVEAPALHNKTLVARVNHLKRNGEYEIALSYVLKELNAHEGGKSANGRNAAPWYYWEAAILYRRLQRYDDEVALIERYAARKNDKADTSSKFLARLSRAQELAAASKAVQTKMDLIIKSSEPTPPPESPTNLPKSMIGRLKCSHAVLLLLQSWLSPVRLPRLAAPRRADRLSAERREILREVNQRR